MFQLLLAEDSHFSVRDLTRKLARWDEPYDLRVVSDGTAAIGLLDPDSPTALRRLPDLVILDLKMPQVDGLEVLGFIRDTPEIRHLPVIVLTTSDSPFDMDLAEVLQVDDYIVKGADAATICRIVARSVLRPAQRPAVDATAPSAGGPDEGRRSPATLRRRSAASCCRRRRQRPARASPRFPAARASTWPPVPAPPPQRRSPPIARARPAGRRREHPRPLPRGRAKSPSAGRPVRCRAGAGDVLGQCRAGQQFGRRAVGRRSRRRSPPIAWARFARRRRGHMVGQSRTGQRFGHRCSGKGLRRRWPPIAGARSAGGRCGHPGPPRHRPRCCRASHGGLRGDRSHGRPVGGPRPAAWQRSRPPVFEQVLRRHGAVARQR